MEYWPGPALYSGERIAGRKTFKENSGLFWTDPAIYEIFDFKWMAGNAKRLNEPNMVVLNETLAKKFFDNAQAAIGKTIQIWSFRIPLNVVGVFKDIPDNSDIPLRMGGSYATLKNLAPQYFYGCRCMELFRRQ